MIRLLVTDAQWGRIAPLLPGKEGDPGRSGKDNPMSPSRDVVSELEVWIGRFSAEARLGRRPQELVAAEIDLLRRAIAEIKALREKLDERRATQSIAAEDLNASNDE